MDKLTKDILGVAVGVQSLSLVKESSKMLNIKNNKPSKMIKGATNLMIGIPLMDATSSLIK